jgi:hypothetical protein
VVARANAMLEHLIDFEPEVEGTSSGFVSLEKSDPATAVDAKISTTDWLKELGAVGDEVATELDAKASRETFSSLITAQNPDHTHAALAQVKTPAAVQHLVGMLTAYDWEFVERAKELRGYTVAKILEETTHPTASVRLKALALLGKVTEVGLFTEKIEIKKTELSDSELDARIKEKLGKMAKIVEITDVTDIIENVKDTGQTLDMDQEEHESSPES